MSEDFGGNFVTLTDEDGNEIELEHMDTIEYRGCMYMAFFPVEEADDETGEPPAKEDEESGLIILKVINVDGEEQLSTLDSEEELNAVYGQFMEELFSEEDGE
ncbi:MAG: DUF1292 domain-containing protein [Intestinimonas sp.]|jgi:uncharacterized protein YrzB (UPF0473 family)|nr:DUF1292 domain-containing protein [Intestinimonas sp.]